MTTNELSKHFNSLTSYPTTFEVDKDTYSNCCQAVFEYCVETRQYFNPKIVLVALGPNNGLMFKNVELILKNE